MKSMSEKRLCVSIEHCNFYDYTERQTQSSEELRHLDSGGGGVAGGQSEADDDSAADHAELRAEYERLLKTQSTGNITEQTAHHSNRLHGMCV